MAVATGRCLLVGDSLTGHIEGARNAGLPAMPLDRYGLQRPAPEGYRFARSLDVTAFDGDTHSCGVHVR